MDDVTIIIVIVLGKKMVFLGKAFALIFGNNGTSDVVSTLAGYGSAAAIAAIGANTPCLTGNESTMQLGYYLAAAGMGLLGRLSGSSMHK